MPNILMTWDGARIVGLREKLGSATRPLSRADLARLVNAQLPETDWISESGVVRYEKGTEPPYLAAKVMAAMAGMSMDEFMLGTAGGTESAELLGGGPVRGFERAKKRKRKRGP